MAREIYIVDDEPVLIELAKAALEADGYAVRSCTDPEKAQREIFDTPPDLVLLDLRMPGLDGLELCRRIRMDTRLRSLPVIIVSAKTQAYSVAVALELGADDYIRKPFEEEELLARVKNALRRSPPQERETVARVGPLRIDPESYEAFLEGKSLNLTPKEFELLHLFVSRPGKVLTRQRISEDVWRTNYLRHARTIDFHIFQLRKKLGPLGKWIKTLAGVGYRFEPADPSREDQP